MQILLSKKYQGLEPGNQVEVSEVRGMWLRHNGYGELAPEVGEAVEEATEDLTEPSEPSEPSEPTQPNISDNKPAWIEYAIAKGEESEAADAMTKDQLIEKYASA